MFERLLKEQTDSTAIQLFRYTFTGSLATIADFYFLFVFTDIFKVHYLASATIAYLIGIAINYFLSTVWVFNREVFENFWVEFSLFTLIGLVGLGFLVVLMWVLTDVFHIYYMFSKALATLLVSLWNFFGRKRILFS
jgi:putative flippase GtrA